MTDREAQAARTVHEAVLAVYRAFEARDIESLRAQHAHVPGFSRWSTIPGQGLLNLPETDAEEEALLAALPPDTRVEVADLRVAIYGPVAVSTFVLAFVGQNGPSWGRFGGTLVWHEQSNDWRIVLEHFSPLR